MYSKVKLIFATSLGSFVEFFDFTVYNFFAAPIAAAIFPNKSHYIAMLLSFSIFALGFFIRPLGGVALGYVADRYGRGVALYWSMGLMGAASLAICCLPSHALIGSLAPLLLILARMIQGFAAGGESSVAASLLVESGTRPGLLLSFQFVAQGLSSFCGAGSAALLSQLLTQQQLYAWGWRLPFLVGFCLIPLGLLLRRYSYTAQASLPKLAPQDRTGYTIKILLSILTILPTSVAIYCMVFYMPHFLNHIGYKNLGFNFLIVSYAGLVMALGAVLGGLLCDRFRRPKLFIFYLLGAIALSAGLSFANLHHGQPLLFVGNYFLCVIHIGMLMTASGLFILQAFPPQIRARSNGLAYCVGVALFGGTTNLAITALQHHSASHFVAFYYLAAALGLGAIIFAVYPKPQDTK